MSHCKFCDFSPDGPSLYHEGLVTSDLPVKNTLKYVKDEGYYICAHCDKEVRAAKGKRNYNEQ